MRNRAHASEGGIKVVLRKMALVSGMIACGAAAGMIGQSLVADAHAPAPTVKTLYAQANPHFVQNLTAAPSTPKTLLKITVHAPSAGVAEVRINSQVWSDFGSTTTAVLENVLTLGRCSAPHTLVAAKCKAKSSYWFHKPENQGGSDSTFPYSIDALMTFGSAGTHTLFLNGASNNDPAGLWGDGFGHVQVAFTPNHPIASGANVTVAVGTPGASSALAVKAARFGSR
jgi:hypothetical protein